MTGILKVDQWKDSGDNALMTSDGAGTLTANVSIASFSSTGIDDNATSTAVTINSSQNVGIGATTIPEILTVNKSSNGGITGLSINNNYPTTSTASSGTGSGIRFGVNDGSFTSAFGDARSSEILSVTQQSNGRTRDIVFKTDNGGTLGEKMRILASGGITFNGDTASANALNDYEEGSFTPSLDIETGSNISVSTIQGYYRKIGNLVAFTIFCVWDKTAGSANMKFTGLPFTCSNQTNLSSQAVNWLQGAYTDQGAFFGGRVFGSSTDVYFVDSKHGSFNSNFDTNNAGRIANTTGIRTYVNGTYFTT